MIRAVLIALTLMCAATSAVGQTLTPTEARAIAKEATIYGFPLVDNYRIQYSYFVDRNSPEFKAPWNTLFNNARVYTPDDKAIQTPNSDTPYSYVGVNLRAGACHIYGACPPRVPVRLAWKGPPLGSGGPFYVAELPGVIGNR